MNKDYRELKSYISSVVSGIEKKAGTSLSLAYIHGTNSEPRGIEISASASTEREKKIALSALYEINESVRRNMGHIIDFTYMTILHNSPELVVYMVPNSIVVSKKIDDIRKNGEKIGS